MGEVFLGEVCGGARRAGVSSGGCGGTVSIALRNGGKTNKTIQEGLRAGSGLKAGAAPRGKVRRGGAAAFVQAQSRRGEHLDLHLPPLEGKGAWLLFQGTHKAVCSLMVP